MDTQQHKNARDKVVNRPEEGKTKQEAGKEVPTTSPASPPSAASSPSHEFSFTISLHPSATPVHDKTKSPTPSSFAIDLSPADDIFFHGHLLPLHLLSQFPVSPRSSTNSRDSFTLPTMELSNNQKPNKNSSNGISGDGTINNANENSHGSKHYQINNCRETKGRSKPKSFVLFGWKKTSEVGAREEKEKHKKKLRFGVSQVLKRYVRMIRPLLLFRRRTENQQFHRQAYAFSGNLNIRNKEQLRGRRGEFSAPASMRTSPTNSGLLVATPTFPPPASDSTMEELQAAIQAAIAHCKNSIAAEEKIKY